MAKFLTLATAALQPGEMVDGFHVRHPRVDYVELQKKINTEIIDYSAYNRVLCGKIFRFLETKLRSDLYLGLVGLMAQKEYDSLFAMSERVGIPLAFFNKMSVRRKPLTAMFQCWSWRQELVMTNLDLFSVIDSILVHCTSMRRHFIGLGVPEDKICVILYGRDHHFFQPSSRKPVPDFILSVGETRSRDYATLFRAVNGLPLKLLVAAGGSWYAREKHTDVKSQPPANVEVSGGFSLYELKELYSQAQFVVLPVYNSVFSAGATVALEAMSMGRTVIASRSEGLTDYIIDGETGILFEPGNSAALKDAIQELLSNPDKAAWLGQNARRRIEQELNVEVYVSQIARILTEHPSMNDINPSSTSMRPPNTLCNPANSVT